MSIRDWLDGNYNAVECRALEEVGWAAFGAALGSAFTGAWVVTAGAAAVNVAAGAAWALGGCGDEEPEWPTDPSPPRWCEGNCRKAIRADGEDVGAGLMLLRKGGESQYITVRELISTERSGTYPNGTPKVTTCFVDRFGETRCDDEAEAQLWPICTEVQDGYICDGDPLPDPPVGPYPPNPPRNPIGPRIPGPEIDGCNWTLTPIDSYVDESGFFHFKYEVCPDRPECGECFTYWHTQNGPQYHTPVAPDPPPPGARDCCDETLAKLDELLAGQKEILENLPEEGFNWLELLTLLAELIELLGQPPKEYDPDTYILKGFCEELNDDGEQPEFSTPVMGGTFDVAVLSRLDAMQHLLQAHLGYKTPTCNVKPELRGDWVTAQWISDEASADSPLRLRKRTRYRSESGRSDAELAAYFAGFAWEAGPVCVKHVGAWWGTPQVWASSANEGKRVIRHLAGEAGIDPDSTGRWEVGGSRNPRFGRTGTMRLRTIDGFPWVSSRDGSDMLPMG